MSTAPRLSIEAVALRERDVRLRMPFRFVDARHTVGLVDPIVRADQANRVDEGLPERKGGRIVFQSPRCNA